MLANSAGWQAWLPCQTPWRGSRRRLPTGALQSEMNERVRTARTETHASAEPGGLFVSTAHAQYFLIPLSIQKEGDGYLVGNSEMGDFYQFPEQGLKILRMLGSGIDAMTIKARLATEDAELVDVDAFVELLSSIGFLHPESERQSVQQTLLAATQNQRRVFDVDPRIGRAIFSAPVLLCGTCIMLYAAFEMIINPQLRVNFNAFYIETNRTALLLLLMILSFIQVALHESGHMLAAARHGIKSTYTLGNRLWTIVAESDLTGILSLPKAQRYFPMLAGMLVDILCASLLTLLLAVMFRHGATGFSIQVVQALVLELMIGIIWQLNIFVKTDIYYVLCTYFGHPDLDKEAKVYLRDLACRATLGLYGVKAAPSGFKNVAMLRVFSLIWLLGRVMSLLVLFGVALPTMAQYLYSALQMLKGHPDSVWAACDTILYVCISLTILGAGIYMWLKNR
jgi:putative peptide zinc metalloprotease protein